MLKETSSGIWEQNLGRRRAVHDGIVLRPSVRPSLPPSLRPSRPPFLPPSLLLPLLLAYVPKGFSIPRDYITL
jgi:hypothetical protein